MSEAAGVPTSSTYPPERPCRKDDAHDAHNYRTYGGKARFHCPGIAEQPPALTATGDTPVTIPADLAHDLIDFMQSVECQWGDEYLFKKFGHTEDVPILVGSLQMALAANNRSTTAPRRDGWPNLTCPRCGSSGPGDWCCWCHAPVETTQVTP